MEDRSILLDVGCGTGGLIELAAEVGGFAVGVDFSLESLTAIKSNEKRIEKVLSDAHNLPFRSESFDRLYCSGSLEHFESASRAVLEMSRVVRKQGGRCLVFVPNSYFLGHVFMVMRTGEPPDEGGQVFAERFGTKMEWYRLLETSGLRVTSVHKFNRIWGSRKVGLFMRVIYNLLLRPFLPSNLSYGWAFICESHSNPVLDGD